MSKSNKVQEIPKILQSTIIKGNELVSNPSLIEHPHGGLILSYCCIDPKIPTKTQIKLIVFDYEANSWTAPKIILEKENSPDLTHIMFLDLKGNLELIYNYDHQIWKKESYNYGKTWNNSIKIEEEFRSWKFYNPPIYVKAGRLLIPVHDSDSGRCMVMISEDLGKTWFSSVFIEIPEDIGSDEIIDSNCEIDEICQFKSKYPSIIHQSESLITVFIQTENLKHIHKANSKDLGETWSDTEPINLPSSNNAINAIRLLNSSGNYTPNICIVFIDSNSPSNPLKVGFSDDNGDNWDRILSICENKSENLGNPQILQTSDMKIHVIYTENKTQLIHSEFDLNPI